MTLKEPKLSIILIHYNALEYLKKCLNSLFEQTYKNFEIYVIDNNSADKNSLDFLQTFLKQHENLRFIENPENTGYARAANQGIRLALSEAKKPDYLAVTNPDIIFTKDYFKKVVERAEKDPRIAAITGKIYKYDFDRDKPTNVIDTVGLFAYKSRRIIDDGQGLIDQGQFDAESEVFGISGACPVYLREALEDVKIFDEYFDEDFFMYKEDVDLCWRFLLYGWKNFYYPKAVAYHGRGTGVYRRFFNKEILKNRSKLNKFQKKYSFKNQYLMEVKNEILSNFFSHFPSIIFRKLAMFFYITFREPFLWLSFFSFIKQLPKALKKRKIIMQNKKIQEKDMIKWFQNQSKYLQK